MTETKLSKGPRIGSMFLDHLAMTLIAVIFVLPGIVPGSPNELKSNLTQADPDLFNGAFGYINLIGFAIYLCKDCINGRSIAKRVLNLQVVDNSTEQAATPLKCLVRNLFCVLWPIEIIVALINPSRRIGDRVAGTKIIPFTQTTNQEKTKLTQIGSALIIAYAFMLLILFLMGGFPN